MRSVFSFLLVALTLAACSGAPPTRAPMTEAERTSAAGELAEGDLRTQNRFVDAYQIEVGSAASAWVTLEAVGFDPVIEVASPSGTRDVKEGNGPLGATAYYEEPEAGIWTIFITSKTPGETGSYILGARQNTSGEPTSRGEKVAAVAVPATDLRHRFRDAAPEVSTPEAPPTRPTPRPAPQPTPEATLPLPDEVADPSVGQSLSGTFTGVDQRYRLDGRERPAIMSPARLLAGDVVTVLFASDAFAPLVALAFEGQPVATAQAESASGGRRSASLRYEIPTTGTYALYLATTDADLEGEFEVRVSFARDRERIRRAPQVEPVTRANGLPHSQISALRATFESASNLGALRGTLLTRDPAAGDVYLSEMPIPGSSQTNVICQGERCSVFAVFPTLDPSSAVNTASNLVTAINTVTDYALDEPAAPSDPNAFMELVSDDVSVRVSYDANRYDERLGVPVTLRIDSR